MLLTTLAGVQAISVFDSSYGAVRDFCKSALKLVGNLQGGITPQEAPVQCCVTLLETVFFSTYGRHGGRAGRHSSV